MSERLLHEDDERYGEGGVCTHCEEEFDDTSECPVRLRAEVDRLSLVELECESAQGRAAKHRTEADRLREKTHALAVNLAESTLDNGRLRVRAAELDKLHDADLTQAIEHSHEGWAEADRLQRDLLNEVKRSRSACARWRAFRVAAVPVLQRSPDNEATVLLALLDDPPATATSEDGPFGYPAPIAEEDFSLDAVRALKDRGKPAIRNATTLEELADALGPEPTGMLAAGDTTATPSDMGGVCSMCVDGWVNHDDGHGWGVCEPCSGTGRL